MTGMYEFDSVSVSSYDAGELAGKLTEKSADGWDVVSIVPAGSQVVAFLRRDSATSAASTASSADAAAATTADAASTEPSPAGTPVAASASDSECRFGRPAPPAVRPSGGSSSGASGSDGSSSGLGRRRIGRVPRSTAADHATGGDRDAVGTGRLVRRSGGPLRAALLGRQPPGPSTCHAPASSSPIRPSPDAPRIRHRTAGTQGARMRATSLGHAGILIETDAGSILCDPWFVPAFFGSWFVFPRNDQLERRADRQRIEHRRLPLRLPPPRRPPRRGVAAPSTSRATSRCCARLSRPASSSGALRGARLHQLHPHRRRRGDSISATG